jgi:hypothetical protein
MPERVGQHGGVGIGEGGWRGMERGAAVNLWPGLWFGSKGGGVRGGVMVLG